MVLPQDTAERVRAALEPYVRPRDEAARIRRVLKAHLAASLHVDGDALDGRSLALVDVPEDPTIPEDARGLQKNYLRALAANRAARRAFEERAVVAAVATQPQRPDANADTRANADTHASILQDHLSGVKLGRKHARLQTVERFLDALAERPVAVAAGEDYLTPEFVYGDATTVLPAVPAAVVDGLASDMDTAARASTETGTSGSESAAQTTAELEALVARLDKQVLQAQLALRAEQAGLERVRVQSTQRAAMVRTAPAAREAALQATRDALIAWIEAELAKAGDGDGQSVRTPRPSLGVDRSLDRSLDRGTKAELRARLVAIQAKYAQYVAARESLVGTVGSMVPAALPATHSALFANMPHLGPPAPAKTSAISTPTCVVDAGTEADDTRVRPSAADRKAAMGDLLLAPYLAQLLAVAHAQKTELAHKAHHSALLTKRQRDTMQVLDHLADESQLLPRHGQAAAGTGALLRKKGVLAPAAVATSTTDASGGLAQRVAAWTDAADAAKIATYEAVFDQVEAGQVALEAAAQGLAQADVLLGRDAGSAGDAGDAGEAGDAGDVWARLNGELGLLT